jgi:hypothetical protein
VCQGIAPPGLVEERGAAGAPQARDGVKPAGAPRHGRARHAWTVKSMGKPHAGRLRSPLVRRNRLQLREIGKTLGGDASRGAKGPVPTGWRTANRLAPTQAHTQECAGIIRAVARVTAQPLPRLS